jgi:hypothetical protein
MKIKQNLVVINPDAFLRGDYERCFTLFGYPPGVGGWVEAGEIEIDVNVDSAAVVDVVTAAIDKEIDTNKVKITLLENRKRELLALTHGVQL